ncbi:hypothetical protein [Halobacillus trueperi]|uniref:DUF3794 domain-containing protein n=1 Tax=Halobacillus trueperi TaxID=156205 RepID=A0A3E0J8L8_9BACI|nr:hypothetical protein [Halobacillus trueperi]REJ09147.1 hypothetical protein DYE48_10530 [Halobacillus trueperi]
MQAKNLNGGQELICMNVDKVYDWIVNDRSFDFSPATLAISFPTLPAGLSFDDAVVTCVVTPTEDDETDPVDILDRDDRTFIINGTQVILQQVNIRKNFTVNIVVTIGGTSYVSEDLTFSRCEQVTLCAPDGTDIEVTYTDLDCFVCQAGLPATVSVAGTITFTSLSVSVSTCQSIQSTYPVTVEFLAEFCEPRDVLPTPCPAPVRPDQCPVVFPNFNGA